ncbi:YfcL family protein [Shewanella sp. NIFS-20-20]|uniref:YfcL family protein n=1 Tax=Shewanella sp. NIFS-20-20 TaxID=2853806 RepID=UPI001C44EA37|nr:YfcL family protein [Shewanella sp. NIFS-20-20]MBV7315019.1 YfcL family protein [Shewanella sp. NIFS-20-20]
MLEKYDNTLNQWIEHIVAQGDDDALFASGYLQGHVTVALAQLEQEGVSGFDELQLKMQQSLQLASRELEDADFKLVQHAWHELSSQLIAC